MQLTQREIPAMMSQASGFMRVTSRVDVYGLEDAVFSTTGIRVFKFPRLPDA